jgi:hypothetical protein
LGWTKLLDDELDENATLEDELDEELDENATLDGELDDDEENATLDSELPLELLDELNCTLLGDELDEELDENATLLDEELDDDSSSTSEARSNCTPRTIFWTLAHGFMCKSAISVCESARL